MRPWVSAAATFNKPKKRRKKIREKKLDPDELEAGAYTRPLFGST